MNKSASILDRCLEWSAMVVVLVGVAFGSLDIFPLMIYIGMVGNLLWLVVSIRWKKWSLVVSSLIILLINAAGLINFWMK